MVSLDLDILFFRYNTTPSYWTHICLQSPGFVYDEAHDFWPEGYPEGLYELTRDSYGSNDEDREMEQERFGYKYTHVGSWEGNVIHSDTTMLDDIPNLDDVLLVQIEDFIKEAESKGIYVIGVIFPQSPTYRETGAMGRYGLRRSVAKKMIEKLQRFEETYPHFTLMDENKMGDHDYDDEMAMNFDHLSHLGAIKLTTRLDSLIQMLNIDWNK